MEIAPLEAKSDSAPRLPDSLADLLAKSPGEEPVGDPLAEQIMDALKSAPQAVVEPAEEPIAEAAPAEALADEPPPPLWLAPSAIPEAADDGESTTDESPELAGAPGDDQEVNLDELLLDDLLDAGEAAEIDEFADDSVDEGEIAALDPSELETDVAAGDDGESNSSEEPSSSDLADESPKSSRGERPAVTDVRFAGLSKGEMPPRLNQDLAQLRREISSVLEFYRRQTPDVRQRDPWEMMHWVVGYGAEAQVQVPSRRTAASYGAVSWLCNSGPCAGESLLIVERGAPVARKGVAVQGHYGQFLAILAQTGVPAEFPLRIRGKRFTVADLVETEKRGCEADMELTFKLIGLAHYLDTDATWRTPDGQTWSISRLISEEIDQPINGVACGGTHRLMGLSYAVRKRLEEGRELSGEFERAYHYVRDYHEYAFALQNRDGSFSTEWLKRRAYRVDPDRWIQTTGHILEWLVYSLPERELTDEDTVRAVRFLTRTLASGRNREWEIGPQGHALRALRLYEQRVFDRYGNDQRFDPHGAVETAELLDHRLDANLLSAVEQAGRRYQEQQRRSQSASRSNHNQGSGSAGGGFLGLFGR